MVAREQMSTNTKQKMYLNLYGYPKERDDTDVRPLPDKWFRINAFMRKGEQQFKL